MTRPFVYSEIGKLKTVLLHRPGKELENLTPTRLKELLFDDIPYLELAQKEHDVLASVLRENGVEVLYVTELLKETLSQDENLREEFLSDVIKYNNITSKSLAERMKEYLRTFPTEEMIEKVISGVSFKEVNLGYSSLASQLRREFPFLIRPMANLYFQRDPMVTIGRGVTINRMSTNIRRRESLLMDYVYKYHPDFKKNDIPRYYDLEDPFFIEGGDVEILSSKVVAVGISQRTEPEAVELLATRLFQSDEPFERVLAFEIPESRAFMHLDTVFTMLDYYKFVIHPKLQGVIRLFSITPSKYGIHITSEEGEVGEVLKKYLKLPAIQIIKCGGDDPVVQDREQWSDGSNTLCVSPGVVIAYSRNYVTNSLIRKAGVEVIEIPSSELSRGRGGPRCMSMPIIREKID
ncbi:arginine deiminase [Mesoaciditoga lauensis]|uniref:arginine deiminase n=1 Tax=Mesoaciditoga lauensis TaxID=1495039 RepID=UPI00056C12BA|nr:arginine deiminase [Mesoaciditoga lauensis]